MKEYIAKKVFGKMSVDDARWDAAEAASLDYVWEDAFPSPYKTSAKLVHSDEGITVRLTTNEWPLTITTMEFNNRVCIDSCMEFFFIPNMDDTDYINFEMNPAAIAVAAKGPGRGNRTRLDLRCDGVKIETRIIGEAGWTVMAFISYYFILKHYSHCGKTMRANFYKCGDLTVKKHFSVWNPIETEKPDYHRPEYFGKIILSDDEL